MSHKVLVLCQRRTSKFEDLTSVTESINKLVSSLLGEGAEIKYVSSLESQKMRMDEDGVDLMGEFGNNDFTRENFRENEFSLIICNTCPFAYMDYSVITKYLKDDGKLALTVFTMMDNVESGIYAQANGFDQFMKRVYVNPPERNSSISKWFVPVEHDISVPVVALFEKLPCTAGAECKSNENAGGGKRRKLKKLKKSIKLKKSRKSKKSRRRRK